MGKKNLKNKINKKNCFLLLDSKGLLSELPVWIREQKLQPDVLLHTIFYGWKAKAPYSFESSRKLWKISSRLVFKGSLKILNKCIPIFKF
jgi:hypothetical protein